MNFKPNNRPEKFRWTVPIVFVKIVECRTIPLSVWKYFYFLQFPPGFASKKRLFAQSWGVLFGN